MLRSMNVIIIVLFSSVIIQTKTIECRIGCIYNGYDFGFYREKTSQCACVDFLDHDIITMKKYQHSYEKFDNAFSD